MSLFAICPRCERSACVCLRRMRLDGPPEPPVHGPEVRALIDAARAWLDDPHAGVGSLDWRRHREAIAAALDGIEEPQRRQNAWRAGVP